MSKAIPRISECGRLLDTVGPHPSAPGVRARIAQAASSKEAERVFIANSEGSKAEETLAFIKDPVGSSDAYSRDQSAQGDEANGEDGRSATQADPGAVMVLNSAGQLDQSTIPYDTRVAGVVSSASQRELIAIYGFLSWDHILWQMKMATTSSEQSNKS